MRNITGMIFDPDECQSYIKKAGGTGPLKPEPEPFKYYNIYPLHNAKRYTDAHVLTHKERLFDPSEDAF